LEVLYGDLRRMTNMKIRIKNPIWGVPITFLDKYNPEQFEILGITCRGYSPEYRIKLYSSDNYERANDLNGSGCILVNNKPKMLYGRILIRKKAGA